MKKKILILAAVVAFIGIISSVTLAYFTDDEVVHNVITTGSGVDIEIEEWQEEDGELIPYPDEPVPVMPNSTVSKIATIKNKEAESYIRAKFEVVFKDANGKIMDLSAETLDSLITIAVNGNDWIRKNGDSEWWYYAEAVSANAVTEALFSEVIFDGPNMTNEYQNCTIEVIVSAEAVQSANNGSSAIEAAGWPTE